MARGSQTQILSLPGPVTSPAATIPAPTGSISLHTLSPTSTNTNTSVDTQAKRDQAWKYEGYKAFSKWMASEDDFFVFRRFESLNAGVILWMQDRIAQIESRVEEIHKRIENSPNDHNLKNCSFRWDAQYQPERTKLMEELSAVLHHYNQYIEAFSKVRARPRAEERQINNVRNWLARDAVDPQESAFINQTGDLVSINSRSQPPLGRWLEAVPWLRLSGLCKAKKITDLHVDSKATIYTSTSTLDMLTNGSIISLGLVMLLAPMWWLEYVSDSETRLQIITGFVCVFCLLMTVATVNTPREVVAAAAAYAAVLMVFMQIQGKA